MHTIKLTIDETVYDKFMVLLELMPKGKVILEENTQIDKTVALSKYFEKITSEDDEILQKLAQ